MAVSIQIENLVKSFGALRAVDHVSLRIEPGELFFLLGPSGCGKTTLLRAIAGFHQPDSGAIRIDGRDITRLPPHQRNTGMVFQSYALWPHLSVAENVAFGLELRRIPRAERRRRVVAALERVHMADRADTKPNLLSGGHPEEHNLRTILEDHALMKMSNVIVTPHIAFNTEEALERILDMTVENIKHWMEGKPQNVVK